MHLQPLDAPATIAHPFFLMRTYYPVSRTYFLLLCTCNCFAACPSVTCSSVACPSAACSSAGTGDRSAAISPSPVSGPRSNVCGDWRQKRDRGPSSSAPRHRPLVIGPSSSAPWRTPSSLFIYKPSTNYLPESTKSWRPPQACSSTNRLQTSPEIYQKLTVQGVRGGSHGRAETTQNR
jgi:hypothetical protein